jgi:serine/threonine protein kinase
MRSCHNDNYQTFKRELGIWARLEHENVLTLIGLVYVEGMPALASEWMENGTMNEYLNEHTDANICEVVCNTIIPCRQMIRLHCPVGSGHCKRNEVSSRARRRPL